MLSGPSSQVQVDCANYLAEHFSPDGLVVRTLKYAESLDHIMDFTRLRALGSLFSMLHQMVRNVLNYNLSHSDFPMTVNDAPLGTLHCVVLQAMVDQGDLDVLEGMGFKCFVVLIAV